MAFDFGKAASGAGTGAIYGAQFGGPWGALAGAGIGAIGGLFGNKKDKNISTFDPKQREIFDQKAQALQGGGGPLADVYGQMDPTLMRDYYEKAYAQPAYQEFEENIVPTITGQFRGQNLQNSSYLGGALGQAGSKVQNNLNGQMAGMLYNAQQSSLNRRQSGIDNILNMNTYAKERQAPSIFDNLLGSLASGAGDLLSNVLNKKKTPAPIAEPATVGG